MLGLADNSLWYVRSPIACTPRALESACTGEVRTAVPSMRHAQACRLTTGSVATTAERALAYLRRHCTADVQASIHGCRAALDYACQRDCCILHYSSAIFTRKCMHASTSADVHSCMPWHILILIFQEQHSPAGAAQMLGVPSWAALGQPFLLDSPFSPLILAAFQCHGLHWGSMHMYIYPTRWVPVDTLQPRISKILVLTPTKQT